jgi:hypothetical protein
LTDTFLIVREFLEITALKNRYFFGNSFSFFFCIIFLETFTVLFVLELCKTAAGFWNKVCKTLTQSVVCMTGKCTAVVIAEDWESIMVLTDTF